MLGDGLLQVFVVFVLIVLLTGGCAGQKPQGFQVVRPRDLAGDLAVTDALAGEVHEEAPSALKPKTKKLKGHTEQNLESAKKQNAEIDKGFAVAEAAAERANAMEAENEKLKKTAASKNWWGKIVSGIAGIFALVGWAGVLGYATFIMKPSKLRTWIRPVFLIVGAALAVGMLITNFWWPLLIGAVIVGAIGVVLLGLGLVKTPFYTVAENHK
jgi:ABC-type multidrug transport system fused ATPase/permease subunit